MQSQEGPNWVTTPLGHVADIYRAMRSGSAMAPFLAMSIIGGIFGLPCLLFGNLLAQCFGIFLIVCTFGSTIVKVFYFMMKDPKQLRPHEHTERMRVLDMFGDKDNPIHVEAEDIVAVISNPSLKPALPPVIKEKHD
jgi:hypothetical protein